MRAVPETAAAFLWAGSASCKSSSFYDTPHDSRDDALRHKAVVRRRLRRYEALL